MEISFTIISLALIAFILALWLTYKLSSYRTELRWQKQLVSLRKAIADQQRAGIKGKVSETFAPFLEGFPFKASECKFLGDPIDYVVFEGLDEREIKGIHLVEVKQGTSRLSKHQKQIKDLVDSLDSEDITFTEFKVRD